MLGQIGGYAWGNSNVSTTVASAGGYFAPTDVTQIASSGQSTLRPNGGTGGIQARYNWQAGNIVYGVELDFDALGLSASRELPGSRRAVRSQAQRAMIETAASSRVTYAKDVRH
jgi:hypothetical protein